jgi:predicted aspartyl protease
MQNNYFIFILLFISFSCSPKDATKKDSAKGEDVLFQGIEIPICYDYDWQIISFDISINGRDTLFAIFDTGADGVAIPKRLENKYLQSKDSLSIATCGYSKIFTERVKFVFWNVGRRYPDDDLSAPRILIGWRFFEDKIIELSFNQQYIRILDNTDNLQGYESVPIIKKENDIRDDIYVPVIISIQGKNISSLSLIDTGFNSTFLSHSGIFSGHKKFTGHFLLADTIMIGSNYICNKNIGITDNIEIISRGKTFDSLIGCTFFENFTLVFDFKNYVLYLKPIDDPRKSKFQK